jgi:hypothetical protein
MRIVRNIKEKKKAKIEFLWWREEANYSRGKER